MTQIKQGNNSEKTNCFNTNHIYRPNLTRTHPFKWIHFPLFVAAWFVLFWFIICPIAFSRLSKSYEHNKKTWPEWKKITYYFWSAALLVFCVIMAVLLTVWKCCSPKSKSRYDKIFQNPEYGDEKEVLCIKCMNFHAPGVPNCPTKLSDNAICCKCGRTKDSFNNCCQQKKLNEDRLLKGPSYDIVLRKQQPDDIQDVADVPTKKKPVHSNKRNSLRSARSRNSSSSSVIISSHDMGTKDLINAHVKSGDNHKNEMVPLRTTRKDFVTVTNDVKQTEANPERIASKDIDHYYPSGAKKPNTSKSKKPLHLKPVDVDLANRQSNVEFFGEKIPLRNKTTTEVEVTKVHYTKPCESVNSEVVPAKKSESEDQQKTGSVGSMESMKKEKFDQYLHLVEINTPFSPENSDNVDKPPLSPREIFFYDLIQAADYCESGNSPDSTHFGFYNKFEKKRPVSHILMTSDFNVEDEIDKSKTDASKRHTLGHMQPIPKIDPRFKPTEATVAIVKETAKVKSDLPENRDTNEDSNIPIKETITRIDTTVITPNESERKTTVKILRTVKKSTSHTEYVTDPNDKSKIVPFSEQNSVQDLDNLRKESVSQFFISDINQKPPKPMRQISNDSNGSTRRNYVVTITSSKTTSTASTPNSAHDNPPSFDQAVIEEASHTGDDVFND